IIHSLMMLAPLVRPDTVVTDAGSTKVAITAAASLLPCRFVGGHPLAGKAERGASAADAQLFSGRPYVLTSEPPAEFLEWLKAIGAIPVRMSPEQHDRVVALTSHLPQLASTALAAELASLDQADLAVSGPGLADMTRLAGSSWDIWADILQTNAGPVSAALDRYIARLQKLRASLPEAGAEFETGNTVSARVRRPGQ
ncbi:MAG TPA: prephenate dehydrogenase/arogenate dehydrogenase family protein, partial [Bryobacteraceae bacterium]|nr:prephenate dehydrogenase/arogenate dehydrogenase family protein [Bryobacteraceae bacterium]